MLVNLAGGDVVVTTQSNGEISLVVTQVKVNLGAWRYSQHRYVGQERYTWVREKETYQIEAQNIHRARLGPSGQHRRRHRDRS